MLALRLEFFILREEELACVANRSIPNNTGRLASDGVEESTSKVQGHFLVKVQGPPLVLLEPLPQVPVMSPLACRLSSALPRAVPSTQSQLSTSPAALQVIVPLG